MKFERRDNKLVGWLIKYGQLSKPIEIKDGQKVYETFAKGAFADAVKSIMAKVQDFRLNIGHEGWAKLTPKNFILRDTEEGVYMEAELDDDDMSKKIYQSVKDGEVANLSVEGRYLRNYQPIYKRLASGEWIKVIQKALLSGVALTARPSYQSAVVFARSEEELEAEKKQTEQDIEKIVEKENQEKNVLQVMADNIQKHTEVLENIGKAVIEDRKQVKEEVKEDKEEKPEPKKESSTDTKEQPKEKDGKGIDSRWKQYATKLYQSYV